LLLPLLIQVLKVQGVRLLLIKHLLVVILLAVAVVILLVVVGLIVYLSIQQLELVLITLKSLLFLRVLLNGIPLRMVSQDLFP